MYFHLYLKIGHFFHIPQFLRKMFFWLFSKLNIKMSYTYRNFATKISFKKGFLKSFLKHPLIAFNNGRTEVQFWSVKLKMLTISCSLEDQEQVNTTLLFPNSWDPVLGTIVCFGKFLWVPEPFWIF